MAYRFKSRESVGEGVIQITCEQTELAIKLLHGKGGVNRDEAVHESRKSIKRLRALFRLVREEMGDAFETENTRPHETGRKLSAIRDAGALIDAFDELRRDGKENLGKRSFASVRRALVLHKKHVEEEIGVRPLWEKLSADMAQ